jgi:hypothetical protein
MTIRLHIDRLVLDGLPIPLHQAELVRDALAAELTRLFTAGGDATGLLSSGGAIPELAVDPLAVGSIAGSNPATLGTQLAQSIHGGLNR